MKKLIALLLALVMVTCMATVAFGTDGAATNDDHSNINTNPSQPSTPSLDSVLCKEGVIKKTYTIKSGTAPAETFTFRFEGKSYVNGDGQTVANATIPAIADQTIEFDAIDVNTTLQTTFSINPDDYQLGVYTYEVTEVTPDKPTAGVTYAKKADGSAEKLYLVLTILRDENSNKHYVAAMHYNDANGNKGEGFNNSYDSGSLTVTKQITGNMADMNKEFSFTVTFNVPAENTAGHAIDYTLKSVAQDDLIIDAATRTVSKTFNLGDGDSAVFANLPIGTTYTIYEVKENYTQQSVTGEAVTDDATNDKTVTGTVVVDDPTTDVNEAADSAEYTNELSSPIDTGVALDSAPYIVMLVVAMAGVVALVSKKRYEV